MSAKLDWLTDRLSDHLNEIRSYFNSPRNVTLVVRNPDGTETENVVIGNDDPDAAIAAIEWSKQEEKRP